MSNAKPLLHNQRSRNYDNQEFIRVGRSSRFMRNYYTNKQIKRMNKKLDKVLKPDFSEAPF